jgi:hypothetical protein
MLRINAVFLCMCHWRWYTQQKQIQYHSLNVTMRVFWVSCLSTPNVTTHVHAILLWCTDPSCREFWNISGWWWWMDGWMDGWTGCYYLLISHHQINYWSKSDTLLSRSNGRVINIFHTRHWPVAGSCEQRNEPSGSIKGGNFFTSWVTISFSRRTLFRGLS